MKKFIGLLFVGASLVFVLSSCTDADTVSHNISKEADFFKIERRVIFYNGITGEYMLSIEGRCSLGNQDPVGKLSVTCKV
jgi:hypothetical protein